MRLDYDWKVWAFGWLNSLAFLALFVSAEYYISRFIESWAVIILVTPVLFFGLGFIYERMLCKVVALVINTVVWLFRIEFYTPDEKLPRWVAVQKAEEGSNNKIRIFCNEGLIITYGRNDCEVCVRNGKRMSLRACDVLPGDMIKYFPLSDKATVNDDFATSVDDRK